MRELQVSSTYGVLRDPSGRGRMKTAGNLICRQCCLSGCYSSLQLFQLVDHAGNDVKAALPEAVLRDVNAGFRQDLGRGLRPAGGQDLEVARDEGLAFSPVLAVQRQHQQLPEGVGIDIKRRAVDVWDADPLPFELVAQVNRIAKLLAQVLYVGIRELIHRSAGLYQLVRLALEQGKVSLAQDGGVGIVHLAEEQVAPQGGVVHVRQQVIHQQHLAEG